MLIKFDLLEERTQRDIKKKDGSCGCHRLSDARWAVCQYHEGFDAAVELMSILAESEAAT